VQKQTDKAISATALQWDDVRHFIELARRGSLSAAARALKVEHSTVARRVEALEASLNLRLFDRLPRGWVLTPEGETLAAQGQRLEAEAQAFARAALGVSSVQGTVRLSAPPVMASHFLVPQLAAWRAQWPGIDLEIIGESREANLARGEADLALRLSRPTAPGLVARPLGELGYGLYARQGYAERPPEQWEFLGYAENLRQLPQQLWLETFAGERRFVLRSNDLAAMLQGARAGLGVTALPHFLACGDSQLARIPGPEYPDRRGLWLVMHPDVKRSPRVRLVADTLIALFESAHDLLAGHTPRQDSTG